MQATPNLGRAQLAQVGVNVLDEVGHVAAAHLGEGHRRALGRHLVVPLVDVVAVVPPQDGLQVGVQVGALDEVPNLLLE